MADRTDDSDLQQLLAAERTATAVQLEALRRAYDDIVAACQHVSTDDEHDPEGATIAFERAQVGALRDAAEQHLADLDRAIEQHDRGAPVHCEVCGEPVPHERLAALPATRRCVACAV